MTPPVLVGIDTGGTFTDFVVVRGNGITVHKEPSTPVNPAEAVLKGLRKVFEGTPDRFVHGSTVATNALLERRGAKIALVTTKGFEDVIEIGRQTRRAIYDINVTKPAPLVIPERRLGVSERVGPTGLIREELTDDEIEKLCAKVLELEVDQGRLGETNQPGTLLDDRAVRPPSDDLERLAPLDRVERYRHVLVDPGIGHDVHVDLPANAPKNLAEVLPAHIDGDVHRRVGTPRAAAGQPLGPGGLREQLDTYAKLWERALDALRSENHSAFEAESSEWKDRVNASALDTLSADERRDVIDAYLVELVRFSEREPERDAT